MIRFECAPFAPGRRDPGPGIVGGRRITSYFGGRIDPISGRPGNHGGMDVEAYRPEPYFAVWDGWCSQGWDPGGGGNWTTLTHASGARVGYGHMLRFEPGVHGRMIPAGTLIGYADSTGKSTGDHLHLAYDSEDPGTRYDDPFDPLMEVCAAGRWPGGTPTPITPPEGLTMDQFAELLAGQAKILALLSPLEFVDDWEQDTRKVIIAGVEHIVHGQAGAITEAGWSSRPYPFRFAGSDAVFYLDAAGNARWIRDPADYEFLTRVLLNPHTVDLPAEARQMVLDRHPIAGDRPEGF